MQPAHCCCLFMEAAGGGVCQWSVQCCSTPFQVWQHFPLCMPLQLTGSGRYPFLAVEHVELDFGTVLVGEEAEQATAICNRGDVAAEYEVQVFPGKPEADVFQIAAARRDTISAAFALGRAHHWLEDPT